MIWLSPLLLEVLAEGADCAIGVSGGKDSQATLITVVAWLRAQGYTGKIFAIFADLGRAEWLQTRSFIEALCLSLQIELVVVQRAQGDLLDLIEQRRETLADTAPFWPSSAARYCTSGTKRGPIDQNLRRFRLVISIEGIRAQESDARAEKEPLTVRAAITGKRYRDIPLSHVWPLYQKECRQALEYQQLHLFDEKSSENLALATLPRFALTWYPLFNWSVEEVWQACGTSLAELKERRQLYQEGTIRQDAALRDQALTGWPAHPAYILGARRLSCSLCVMADNMTLLAGAIHQPDYYRTLCWLEIQSGYSFQSGKWLCDLVPTLLTDEMRSLLEQHPRRQHWLEAQAERQKTGRKARKVLPVLSR
ncbi:MAG: phosphoadenosine phosphosulfate reductase family protein [Ktedonobacteraceae bacterium]|nr:phosphoadenosine phosphosulfate reductase family protein [Ktedonobacteraceae bacterium]